MSARLTNYVQGEKTVQIAVYQSTISYEYNNELPAKVAATYLAGALKKTPYGYEIHYGFEPLDTPTERSGCGARLYDWFRDQDLPLEAKDSNVLITNSNSGGCGLVGGKYCTGPGGDITRDMIYTEEGTGDAHNDLHAILHEVGHNLGAFHDHDGDQEGKQHWGYGENRPHTWFGFHFPWMGGDWFRTPCVAGNGAPNECGEWIEEREYESVIHGQYYHDCAVERFDIK